MNKKLQILLYVIAAYLLILGLLFLFFPSIAAQVMQSKLPDATLNILYGQVVVTFAFVAFMAAQKAEAGELWRAVLVLAIGHVLVFGYLLLSGRQGFPQVGPPLIINIVFAVLLYLFRK